MERRPVATGAGDTPAPAPALLAVPALPAGCTGTEGLENLHSGSNIELERLGLPRFYVIVSHLSKKANIGTLLRCASAFGVREVLVAGNRRQLQTFGAQGTQRHVCLRYFESLETAAAYARARGCSICGVEIKPESRPLTSRPFSGPTAFVMGNEGEGLHGKQVAICDWFCHIPQYGCGTASLNVAVAAGIVFQHFASWAQYPERAREGEKFVVKAVPAPQVDEAVRELRRLKKLHEGGGVSAAKAAAAAAAAAATATAEGAALNVALDPEDAE
jgi:tRNA C32,U32 (ribose-2'-O)-methylase TrmJ